MRVNGDFAMARRTIFGCATAASAVLHVVGARSGRASMCRPGLGDVVVIVAKRSGRLIGKVGVGGGRRDSRRSECLAISS